MKRRSFLALGSGTLAAQALGQEGVKKRRVAVVGHTGRGDYGHALDTVWLQIPGAEIVGVADPVEKGREKALKRLKAKQGFGDYKTMFAETKPEFVTICPRYADQHAEMTIAAMEAGVKGIYVEKPFCRTPAEADQIIAAGKKHDARVAVAHRNAYHVVMRLIEEMLEGGMLGKLLEIRGRGKGDRRGGAEDLWVLGSHVMNLIHFFGGEPKSCSAVMLQNGERVTAKDVREGAEGLGPLAGNELHARYEMSRGVIATFDSIANDETKTAGFGLQLIGSKGIIAIRADRNPVAHFVPGNPFLATKEPRPWIPITSGGLGKEEPNPQLIRDVHSHVIPIKDLIAACDHRRNPICDARAGATTVEMISAVFESHRQEGRAVAIPLKQRENALAKL